MPSTPTAPPPSAKDLLEGYRLYHRLNARNGRWFWDNRSPEERAAMRAQEALELDPGAVSELPCGDDGP